jgi:hypothetical protein
MSLGEGLRPQEELANNLASIVTVRISEAKPIETLSDRDDKLLRLMEDSCGNRFVTRSYTPKAIETIEQKHGQFDDAWDGMHEVFGAIGIGIPGNHFIRTGEDAFPIVVVSEYLGDVRNLDSAPTKTKKRIAGALGSVLSADTLWVPGSPMMRPDMFGVPTDSEGDDALLVDIDPFVVRRELAVTDESIAWYLGKLGKLFWDSWCAPEEREEVFGELIETVAGLADEEDGFGQISQQIQILRRMRDGVDTRETNTPA